MIDTPGIVETRAQQSEIVRITVPRDQIKVAMARGFSELMAGVTAQGMAVTGPWPTHDLRLNADVFGFEAGVPVGAAIPIATVVRRIYHGDYKGPASDGQEVDTWIMANGHAAAPNLWEVYLTGPDSTSNPTDHHTELNRPILR